MVYFTAHYEARRRMEVLGAHSLFFPITAPSTQLSCYYRSPNTGNSLRVGVEFILGSPVLQQGALKV